MGMWIVRPGNKKKDKFIDHNDKVTDERCLITS